MHRNLAFEPNYEIGDEVVCLPVVKIWNGEAKTGILDECIDGWVGVDQIRGRLFPLLRVCNHVIQMAVDDFANLPTCPEIHVNG